MTARGIIHLAAAAAAAWLAAYIPTTLTSRVQTTYSYVLTRMQCRAHMKSGNVELQARSRSRVRRWGEKLPTARKNKKLLYKLRTSWKCSPVRKVGKVLHGESQMMRHCHHTLTRRTRISRKTCTKPYRFSNLSGRELRFNDITREERERGRPVETEHSCNYPTEFTLCPWILHLMPTLSILSL